MLPKYIYSSFWTDKDLRKNDIILTILKDVISFDKIFLPNMFYLSQETRDRYVRFKIPDDFDRVKKAINVYGYLSFGFMREKVTYFHINFGRRSYDGVNEYGRKADPNTINVELEKGLFEDDFIVSKFVRLCKIVYDISKPYYGYLHESRDGNKIARDDEWLKIYHKPQFCMLYWANFFGPSVVENYGGKSKFLNAPCWKVEELDDGGILLVLYPNPLNPEKKEKREIQNNVLEYFGLKHI